VQVQPVAADVDELAGRGVTFRVSCEHHRFKAGTCGDQRDRDPENSQHDTTDP